MKNLLARLAYLKSARKIETHTQKFATFAQNFDKMAFFKHMAAGNSIISKLSGFLNFSERNVYSVFKKFEYIYCNNRP